MNKALYEVPGRFIGNKIDIRLDEHGVYVFEDDKKVADAIPVSMNNNAHVKRAQSPFALSKPEHSKEGDHV